MKKPQTSADHAKQKLRARRSLSQNFLVDGALADRIAASAPLGPGKTVYEIGAGKGFITERLVATGAEVWAIEKDRRLYNMLRKKFPPGSGVQVHWADMLDLSPQAEPPDGAWIVGNLPFGIGHAILQALFDRRRRFPGAILTLQREVVARLIAAPGSSDRSSASVWFQARATGHRLFDIPPRAFVPPPKVTSTVMWVEFNPATPGVEHVPNIEYIVERAFAQKRKVLENNLRAIAHLTADDWTRLQAECGDLLRKRAEELRADEFVRLAQALPHLGDTRVDLAAGPGTGA
ncbi:MAG: 16S rRNA (adenine(1518)-N(6)/adenine(1519)-N(6))-dimethyltransferase RsmA [Candidatus Zixiibacteriota bacterium]